VCILKKEKTLLYKRKEEIQRLNS